MLKEFYFKDKNLPPDVLEIESEEFCEGTTELL
jgi:hypothetical protein